MSRLGCVWGDLFCLMGFDYVLLEIDDFLIISWIVSASRVSCLNWGFG